MKCRRANAVLFGFDFQRNAAIVLMLENIKDLHTIRLEGNHEDIELTLDNGRKSLRKQRRSKIAVRIFLMCEKICRKHLSPFQKDRKEPMLKN